MWKRRKNDREMEDEFNSWDYDDTAVEEPRKPFRKRKPVRDTEDFDDYDLDDESVSGRRGKKHSGWIGIVAAAVAAVLLLMIFLPTSGGNKVYTAMGQSGEELLGYTDAVSVMPGLLGRMAELVDSGDYSMELGLKLPTNELDLEVDYSTSSKKLDGSLRLANAADRWQIGLDFYGNKKKMYFEAPELFQDAYGFTVEDFNQRFEGSFVWDIFPVKGLQLHLFSPTDLRGQLKRSFGSDWDAFEESLTVKKFEKREIRLGLRTEKCTIYRISWDPAAADKLLARSTGPLEPLAGGILKLIPDLEPELRVFLDGQDRLVGCDFATLAGKYTLLLEGQENVWESFSLEVLYINGTSRHLTGSIGENDECLQLLLNDEAGDFFLAEYNNATGEFSIRLENEVLVAGILKKAGEGVELELRFGADTVVSMLLSPLKRTPVGPTRSYVELFDLSAVQRARLWAELVNSELFR